MGTNSAEFELGLRWRREDESFDISIHYNEPDDARDSRELGSQPLSINAESLSVLSGNLDKYATALTDQVLRTDPDVLKMYEMARAVADTGNLPLHFRLLLDLNAPSKFHALRWELLRDPDDDRYIATRNNIIFSRFLSTSDWRIIPPPRKHDLRALVVVAAPNLTNVGPGGRDLAPINTAEEVARAERALKGISVKTLPDNDKRATLPAIREALTGDQSEHGIDVLYIVCHGAFLQDESVLYLEKADGGVDPVKASRMAEMIDGLSHRPTLAVICACRSAGGDNAASDEVAFKALGPLLAKAGIPAVLAMQGDFTMNSAELFLPAFFRELRRNGVIDSAVAYARGQIADRDDWWMPVLFSRLRTGRTYYLPEFSDKSTKTWQALIDSIQTETCTPVVGPGVADHIMGSRSEIARRWVERWQAPINPQNRTDLAKVAQYLAVRVAQRHPEVELLKYLTTELRDRHRGALSEEMLGGGNPEPTLLELGRQSRENDPHDPFLIIAQLRAPIFITTNWTGLLEDALRAVGKQPMVRSFDWTETVGTQESLDHAPTVDRPLVYHMFGQLESPETLVLSEDDYFAWLKSWIERRNEIKAVGTALTRRSLLFLGYELDDWDFRVLFQGIQSFGGIEQTRKRQHVGVQLSPDSQLMELDAAQDYLESYFGLSTVRIFWGETSEFLRQLHSHLQEPE